MVKSVVSRVLATVLGGCLVGTTLAGTVYKWVDPQGAVHYSDAPPPDGVPVVDAMRFDLPPAPPPSEEDYYSIANQARRMEAERLALERERQQRREQELRRQAEQLELEARERALQAQQEREEYGPSPYLLGYPYPYYYAPRPNRLQHRPWPGRPEVCCGPGSAPSVRRVPRGDHEPPPRQDPRPTRMPAPRPPPPGVSRGMAGPAPQPGLPPPARR
jgi:hypothetical protein